MDMYETYCRVSKRLEKEFIEKYPQVIGVMHLGGVARHRADEDSDIDISLFSLEPIEGIFIGEQFTEDGYDLDLFNIAMNKGFDSWDSIQKEAYQEGFISYDPTGKVKEFIDKALYFSEEHRKKEIARLVFALAWHGWIYTEFRNRKAYGYNWILPKDLWFKRNDKENAFFLTQVCVNDFIELLYVYNKRWTPDFKWKLVKSRNLPWLPTDYNEKINYLLFGEWTEESWSHKDQVFQEMLDELIERIIPIMPENWYSLLEE